MSYLQDPLWLRLNDFEFDDPDAALSFSKRLARENGWSLEFTWRVIEEYRRFLYLAAVSKRAVTPSDAVDQTWHLHLCYSRSYWDELCQHVLQRPLHHGPTRGGESEANRYLEQYEATLRLYNDTFGALAPSDIWPVASVRFGHDLNFQRVNLTDYRLFAARLASVLPRATATDRTGSSRDRADVVGVYACARRVVSDRVHPRVGRRSCNGPRGGTRGAWGV